MRKLVLLVGWVAIALQSPSSPAQTGATASVVGTVTDPSGAVVPNATITATNVQTDFLRTTKTGSNGEYTIFSLPIGRYSIRVEAQGFSTTTVKALDLTMDQVARVDARLTIGQVNNSVTISGESAMLKTDDSSLSEITTQKVTVDLPLNGRNVIQLAGLSASVTPGEGSFATSMPGSFYGQRTTNTQFRLDGINTSEWSLDVPHLNPDVDAIQEFTIIKGIYPAEYGQSSGGTINVAVRSGTNQYHGTAFEFLRNTILDARNYFDLTGEPPNLKQSQFGGIFGGPIKKDKLFFFFSYNGERLRHANVRTTAVPSPQMLQGNFSGVATITDPLTGNPFPNNQIPDSRINPISQALSTFWPAPNNPSDPSRNYVSDFSEALGTNQYLGRVDYSLSTKDQIFARYAIITSSDAMPPLIYPFADDIHDRDQSAVLGYTRTFSPTVVNETRFGFTRIVYNYASLKQFPDFPSQANIPDVTRDPRYADVPSVTITGYAGLGVGNTRPYFKTQNNFEFVDNLMISRGSHALKMGVDMVHRQEQQLVPLTKRGSFTFAGQYSGNNFADFLLGVPSQTQLGQSPYVTAANMRATDVYPYIQDDWHVASRLTLNIGLRYEYDAPPADVHGTSISFDPYTATFTPAPLTPGVRLGKPDLNNFAPRFGFVYRPYVNQQAVLRGGYGIYYNAPDYDGYLYLPYNPPFGNVLTYQSLANQSTLSLSNPFPTGVGTMGAPAAYGVDPNLRIGYVQFYTFGIEQQLASTTILDIQYVGDKSTRLQKAEDVNYAPPGPGAVQPRRRLRTDLASTPVIFSAGNGTYQALQVQLERSFSRGLYFLASYGWAKELDDVATTGGDRGQDTAQDPRCPNKCEKGPPNWDLRNRFTTSFIYDLPFEQGKTGGLMNIALGGWEITSIFTVSSGDPLTPTVSGDPMNIGYSGMTRADYLGGNVNISNRTISHYFNTAAFAAPPLYTPGSVSRGIMRGPGLFNWDFSVNKNFSLPDRQSIQFRAEFFNFTNHPYFRAPGVVVGTPTFGKITSAGEARDIQFGLKYIF